MSEVPSAAGQAAAVSALPLPLLARGLHSAGDADRRARRFLLPTRIVWQPAAEAGATVENSASLLRPAVTDQITLQPRQPCVLGNAGTGRAGLLLDFGTELHGAVQLLVGIGDMHPETSAIQAVFGYDEAVPRSLDLIRDQTPLPGWMNGISSYSVWWVLIHHGWYRQNGDLAYLRQQQTYLAGLLDALLGAIGPDGREQLPPHRFLDWPSVGNDAAVHAGLHALLTLSLQAGAELCTVLGADALALRCRHGHDRLRCHVPDPGGSKQAAALLALAGLGDPVELNRTVLAVDGPRRVSTFLGYYVLQARALAGDVGGALDTIRRYWGAMLDLGATTFWEDFDLDWTENAASIDELVPPGRRDIHGGFGNHCYKGFRHSLCHGWASGPAAWLAEHVLGVTVVEPGGTAVRIAPRLGDLAWVEGTYPTPHGVVRVRHERTAEGGVRSQVDLPPGVRRVA